MTLSTSALSALKKLAATREALVAENAIKAESLGAYRASMRDKLYADQIPFEEWLAKQPPKETGFAEGGYVNNESAAFGVYPQMKPRRAHQDREAAKDAPLSALRGWAAGTLGLPGDLEGLVRMLTPGVSNEPALPTSEHFRSVLPLRSLQETPTGRAFTELGGAAGGAGLGSMVRATGTGATALGRLTAEQIARGVESGHPAFAAASPAYVIKPKGGNWLNGSVEDALSRLKHGASGEDVARAAGVPQMEFNNLPLAERLAANQKAVGLEQTALNNWVDKQLTRYVKNEMATPSIIQIKGKANHKPNDEYLPYVQDFVKSGERSDVGDLGNTGLRRTSDAFNDTEQAFLRSKGVDLKPYIDPEETARYKEMFKKPEPGFAAGGTVDSTNQGYNPAHVDRLVNQLRTELFQ